MTRTLKIWEQGYVLAGDEEILVVATEVHDGLHVGKTARYRVPMNAADTLIAVTLMEMLDCEQFVYQAMWTLPRLTSKDDVKAQITPLG